MFDKECMRLKYSNPHLTNGEMKGHLNHFITHSKPQRYLDSLSEQKSITQSQMMGESQYNESFSIRAPKEQQIMNNDSLISMP